MLDGRHRRCGSQQGNARRAALALGLADERADMLVERLLHWQWPDGGWNCLGGLAAMVEAGKIRDRRCADALDLLESKRLPDGGWPKERRYERSRSSTFTTYADYVDWGGAGRSRMNECVTVEALMVLQAAGARARLKVSAAARPRSGRPPRAPRRR